MGHAPEPNEPTSADATLQSAPQSSVKNDLSGANYGTAMQAGTIHGGVQIGLGASHCYCGFMSIGLCVECRQNVCSKHGASPTGTLMCLFCANTFVTKQKKLEPVYERMRQEQREEQRERYISLPLMNTASLAAWLTSPGIPKRGDETSRPGPITGQELLAAIRLTRIPPKTRPNQGTWRERRRNPVLVIGWPVYVKNIDSDTSSWSEKRYLQPDGCTSVERSGTRTSMPTGNEILPASTVYEPDDLFQAHLILKEWQRHYPPGAALLPEV